MSSSNHDDHNVTEQKPVSFTVPLIMASVLVLIMVLFLSLCDPKPHGNEAGHVDAVHSNVSGNANPSAHGGEAHKINISAGEEAHTNSVSAETTKPTAEPRMH